MKTTFTCFLMLFSIITFSQNLQPEVYLFTNDERVAMTKLVSNQAMSAEDSSHCVLLADYPNQILREMSDKAKYNITGLKKDFLIVVFRDVATNRIVPITQGNLSSVEVNNSALSTPYSHPLSGLTGNYLDINLSNVPDYPQSYSINSVTIIYQSAKTRSYYYRYLSSFSAYGINVIKGTPLGLWVPIGQFGSNFKKTSQGIIFNGLPIGAALGTKINFSSDFYLGVSYSFDYTITKSGESTDSFSFKSFSHGPILDFGDWFQVGFNWYANLTSDNTYNREPFVVVGVGVKLLDLVKNKNSK